MVCYQKIYERGTDMIRKFTLIFCVFLLTSVLLIGCSEAEVATPTEPMTQEETVAPTETTEATEPTEPEPTAPPFIAQAVADTDPSNFNTQWEIYVEGELTESYTREEPLYFEDTQ